jgi:AcrR family transcriptional regulator
MSTLSRKQREIRQREEAILNVARQMLVEQGFAGLNMDRVAEVMEYSKGVVYSHFKSKEDLVAALAVQTIRARVDRFQRAAAFEGRPREKMLAIGVAEELFVRVHPYHFHSEQIIKLASLHERASAERLAELRQEEAGCFSVVGSVIQMAVACGDLAFTPPYQLSDLVYALWGLHFGCFTIQQIEQDFLAGFGIAHPYEAVRRNCHLLLDGYGWQPLSTQWDFEQSKRLILEQVFPEESIAAGMRSGG